MRIRVLLAVLLVAAFPLGSSNHTSGCVPGAADPATYIVVDLSPAGGGLYYVEERGGLSPVPGTGYVLGSGTFVFEETNGVPGLQRGQYDPATCVLLGPGLPCLLFFDDFPAPLDAHCGHGPDGEVVSVFDGE